MWIYSMFEYRYHWERGLWGNPRGACGHVTVLKSSKWAAMKKVLVIRGSPSSRDKPCGETPWFRGLKWTRDTKCHDQERLVQHSRWSERGWEHEKPQRWCGFWKGTKQRGEKLLLLSLAFWLYIYEYMFMHCENKRLLNACMIENEMCVFT